MSVVLAISWEPELRGLLTVVMAVAVFCGSIYLVLATNLGARLGFLVSLASLAGWMALMGVIWTMYGIGLQGRQPSWEPAPEGAVLQSQTALVQVGALDDLPDLPDDTDPGQIASLVAEQFTDEGWEVIPESDPTFGQAASRAGELVEETDAFAAGEYEAVRVFDTGGDRFPKINDTFDFMAFRHTPHYVAVEIAPLVEVREEEGRAPATPQIDEERDRQYVYMIRDLGTARQPAQMLTVGSTLVLLASCYLLHRRDALVARNRALAAEG